MRDLSRILAYVSSSLWMIEESRASAIAAVLARRAAGVRLSAGEVESVVGDDRRAREERAAATAAGNARRTGVAVVPLVGTIVPRQAEVDNASGGGLVSLEGFLQQFRAALAEPSVTTVILDVDSPGGVAAGVPEAAAEVAASPKQVVAVANTDCCSAAYYLASQASEFVASDSSRTGSVGVYMIHFDFSKQLEADGVTPTLIRHGDNKAQSSEFFPLSPEARADFQRSADSVGAMFDSAVAKGRGVSVATVRSKFGQGRVFDAREAVDIGMADRVATLDATIARFLAGGRASGPRQRAQAEQTLAADVSAAIVDAVAPAVPAALSDTARRRRELDRMRW